MKDEEWINTRQDSTARRKTVPVPVSLVQPAKEALLEVPPSSRNADIYGELSALFPQPSPSAVPATTCPKCRHAAHADWCPNMASDNDCACTYDSNESRPEPVSIADMAEDVNRDRTSE